MTAPQKLLDKATNVLRLGKYWDDDKEEWTGVTESKYRDQLGIGAAAVDWDLDGDLDLILGSHQGNFYLRLNEGSRTKAAFATESVILRKNDMPLEIPGHDAVPEIADWDGDGRFDILSGSGSGGVYWLRNTGKKGDPRFETPQLIVQTTSSLSDSRNPTWPGPRTQVCVTDYDGDGDLDLLVGDYNKQDREMHGWVWLFKRR